MEPVELLERVVCVLDKMQLDYAVGGSMASMFYGEARFTNDIDIVVDLTSDRVQEFVSHFSGDEFYVSEEAANGAIEHQSQFNILVPDAGLKVDIIIPKAHPHDRLQFSRTRLTQPAGTFTARYAAPEDIILKKMQAYEEGQSDKHLRDIASMLKINGYAIDHTYIADWAQTLGLSGIWSLILNRVGGNP